MSSHQRQSFIRVSFEGLDAISRLWSEIVDRTDVEEIILHIVGNYQLTKLSLNTAEGQKIALSKSIRSFHTIWQMQMLHSFSSPRFWHGKHKLYLLNPQAATTSIQFLTKTVTEAFDKYGREFGVEAGYSIMTHLYDVIFCALRAMLLSPFEYPDTVLEPLETAICSAALSGVYNEVLPASRGDDNVLTYLRNACQAILYHLNDRTNEEAKSLIQFTRDLNVGHFTESNDPQTNNQILSHLSSLEGTQSLEQEGSIPPNFRRFCQMYDIYLAVLGICANHKAKRQRSRLLIDPPTLEFAKNTLTKFQAVAVKVPLNIQKPVFRLATSLGRFFSPPVIPRNADYFTSQDFYGDFWADLQKRSNMLTLSEPCFTTFRRDVGNVFQNMSKVDGTHAPLTALIDDAVPFAISNCTHSHVHSQGSRRHIDTTSSAVQKYCHICTYSGDDARITGWREVKELTTVHNAFIRLRNSINQITSQRMSELPASRHSAADPFPRISPPASTPSLEIQANETPLQEQNPFQSPPVPPTINRDAPGPPRASYGPRSPLSQTALTAPEIREPGSHSDRGSTGGMVNLPTTPPRSDGSSPASSSPGLIPASPPASPPLIPPRSTDPAASNITRISSGFAQLARRRFGLGISREPSPFAELFTNEHRSLNTTCAFSRNCENALFWSKAYVGAFSVQQAQAQGGSPTLIRLHKYPDIQMDWERPVIAVSNDVFAVASPGEATASKVSIYRLSSSTQLQKEIPVDGFISNLSISPDDSLLAIGTFGRSIQIHYTNQSVETRKITLPSLSKRQYTYENNSSRFQKMNFCSTGRNLVVATCETVYPRGTDRSEHKVHVWLVSLQGSEKPGLWRCFDAPYAYDPGDQGLTSILYNPLRNLACVTFWTTSHDGQPCLVSKSPDTPPYRIKHKYLEPKIQAAAFSPSGTLLVLVGAEGRVFKVNLANNNFVTKLDGTVGRADRPGESVQLRITEDSKWALVLGHDGKKGEVWRFGLGG